MANEITSSTTSSDQEKFLAARLVQRAKLRMIAYNICDKVEQPKGTGLTANFIRYNRMNVPLTTLTEGSAPSNSTFTLSSYTVTLDQWGDVITLTDVTQLTTSHPVLNEAINLLADNAQRVIDREVQIVWLAGTNVTYGDASVTARKDITTAMKISDTVIHRAVVTMEDAGTPPRGGPAGDFTVGNDKSGPINQGMAFVGVCGPQVCHDIMAAGTSLGTWAAVAMYANQKALYNGEMGTWLGVRWVVTNFIPKFTMLGSTTAAVTTTNAFGANTPTVTTATSGGALKDSTTFFYKVTRKSLTRGFEEDISVAHSTATGAAATADDNAIAFYFDAANCTAGYVYNLYFDILSTGSSTGADANMKLVSANIAIGATTTVTAVQTTGAAPPANVNTTGTPTIHPVYIHGAESCNWVGLQNLRTYITTPGSSISDPLDQQRKVGYKFLGKAMIRDQNRLLRLELASSY